MSVDLRRRTVSLVGRNPAATAPVGRLTPDGTGWIGAHGGAGVSTLAGLLGGADLGCRWPDPDRAEPARVFLVARTHASGLQAASQTLNAMREGRHPSGMELVALVLVADAPGSLPRALLNRVRVLRSVAPVQRIPWITEWRLGEQPRRLPRQVDLLDRQLRELGVAQ
ncbi:DUF6668 family protein [Actinoplanes sp. NBRC 101535]|uniref:DUF6668 family protein n=1 Tax=Actinoplanes sp. NBRC 101535 TaxID=3032196 RepID=UPI0024A25D71|nr:DUF6668 family protein [Actinoplanes sp. NBRC 101535]GLY02420.1 hypothetical protein Acsp01_27990 [Actinoplanes sp. NBRC 101535]